VILASETITRRRFAAGSWGTGGIFTNSSSSDTSIKANVQPLTPDQLQRLAEGKRGRKSRLVMTTSDLRISDGTTPTDRVVIDSIVYEVDSVERYRGILPHYEAVVLAVQEGE
jgi:hypothetical protein